MLCQTRAKAPIQLKEGGIALVISDLSNPPDLILSPLRLPIPPLRREADSNIATMAHRHFYLGPSRPGYYENDSGIALQCQGLATGYR